MKEDSVKSNGDQAATNTVKLEEPNTKAEPATKPVIDAVKPSPKAKKTNQTPAPKRLACNFSMAPKSK